MCAFALLLILNLTTHGAFCDQQVNTRALSSAAPVRGVNLGGWFVTEQWITPSLFSSTGAVDEWTLCNELGKKQCLSALQKHWNTFYTRADFLAIKAAGLNAVRIPLGYWAVDLNPYEPYVSGQYQYLIRAVQWAGELGLSVVIDLHGAPGSQNGQDNSGLIGDILFASNSSNADRSLNVLRNLTQEFTSDIYRGVVTGIELLNEPRLNANDAENDFSMDQLKGFYTAAADVVRQADPTGKINITYHDAFYGPSYWTDYSPFTTSTSPSSEPATSLVLDTHQYYAFAPLGNLTQPQILEAICNISALLKQPQASIGIPYTIVGEWSLQTGAQDPHGSSSSSTAEQDDAVRRTWFRLLFEAQLAAYSPSGSGQASLGWFFWTWQTEWDIDTWSYRRGIEDGWIPTDVGNSSLLVYPRLQDGCVDAGFNYTAPLHVGASQRVGVSASLALTPLAVLVLMGLELW